MLDAAWAGLSWVGFTGLPGAHDGWMVMGGLGLGGPVRRDLKPSIQIQA